MQLVLNGNSHDHRDDGCVAELLEAIAADTRCVAVTVNDVIVPRDRRAGFVLHKGDRVEVLTGVGGG